MIVPPQDVVMMILTDMNMNKLEKMAHTHALFLYPIVGAEFGDHLPRSSAEQSFIAGFKAAKELAVLELQKYISGEPDGTAFKKIVLTNIAGIETIGDESV